jgi:tetratricopeptide (TPR) repeat protein
MRNLKAIVLALGLLGSAETFREPLPANHTTRLDCPTTECLSDLSRRGNALFDNGSFHDALPLLEAANRNAVALGAKREQSLIAVRIGRIHQAQGHIDRALESYREASALADELNDDRLRAEALIGKAAFEYSQANLPSPQGIRKVLAAYGRWILRWRQRLRQASD